jgi:hydroxyacylglutathione hydrolase
MYFRQFYLGCLAQASYMIGSEGEAAVVDPRRDVDEYIAEAERQGLAIRHIVETHLHADFVSGHRELAQRTGARIYIGARAGASFAHVPVVEGTEISFGAVTLRFLETPGHTPESVCVLVTDSAESPDPKAVLTGDTLFVGDVGRPDLLGAAMPATELAGLLYDSLHQKLLTLSDAVEVYPAHGAGSLCGKNISSETSSTIGQQRRFNHALAPMPREEFVRRLTSDLPEAPGYFARDVEWNRRGAASLSELPALEVLEPGRAAERIRGGAIVLDVRPAQDYGAGHIPDSVHVGLSGQFASWAGTVLPAGARVVLVAGGDEAAGEARMRLARVGIEDVTGFLGGGIAAWSESGRPVVATEQIAVAELKERLAAGGALLDVRRSAEVDSGRIEGSVSFPLARLASRAEELDGLDRCGALAAICAGAYRSSIATSLLERHGFTRIANVVGGMAAWTGAGFKTV